MSKKWRALYEGGAQGGIPAVRTTEVPEQGRTVKAEDGWSVYEVRDDKPVRVDKDGLEAWIAISRPDLSFRRRALVRTRSTAIR